MQVTGYTEPCKNIFIIDGQQAWPTTHGSEATAKLTDEEAMIPVPEGFAVILAEDVAESVDVAMNFEKIKTRLRKHVVRNFKSSRCSQRGGLFATGKISEGPSLDQLCPAVDGVIV